MLSWALQVYVTHAVLHLHGYIYRYAFILMLSLKFWSCLRAVYLHSAQLLLALRRCRWSCWEHKPKSSGCSGAAALAAPASSALGTSRFLEHLLLNCVLEPRSCSVLSCLLHFGGVPPVVSFNIHIHIFSVLAGVYFTLTWGVFGC